MIKKIHGHTTFPYHSFGCNLPCGNVCLLPQSNRRGDFCLSPLFGGEALAGLSANTTPLPFILYFRIPESSTSFFLFRKSPFSFGVIGNRLRLLCRLFLFVLSLPEHAWTIIPMSPCNEAKTSFVRHN